MLTATRSPGGLLTRLFYDDAGRMIALERSGQRYAIIADDVGTPRAVVDATGTVVKSIRSDSFGRALSDSNPAFTLPLGFAGGLADPATGLVRFGKRDYEPDSGRWTARDPILFDAVQPNLYAYVASDPVNHRDPSGLAAGGSGGGGKGRAGKPRGNICFGGSSYRGLGGGMKVCFGTGGFAVCGEVGVGIGAKVEVSVGGEIPSTGVTAEVTAQIGPIEVGVEASITATDSSVKASVSSGRVGASGTATRNNGGCGGGGGTTITGGGQINGKGGVSVGASESGVSLSRATPGVKASIGGCISTG